MGCELQQRRVQDNDDQHSHSHARATRIREMADGMAGFKEYCVRVELVCYLT